MFFFGIVLAYFAVVVLGLPTYFLLRKLGISSVWVYLGLASAFGAVLYEMIVANLISPSYDLSSWPRIALELPMSLAGLTAGLVFWLTARPDRHPPKRETSILGATPPDKDQENI